MDSMLARGIALFLFAMGCGSSRQRMVITVHGDRTDCILSIAAVTAEAGGASRIDLTVTVGPVSPPKSSAKFS